MLPADAHLKSASWFKCLEAPEQERVLVHAGLRVIRKGEILAGQGEVPAHWIGVAHGALKASTYGADGRVWSHLLANASEWAEAEALLLRSRRRYDIAAIRDSVVVLLPAHVFRALFRASTTFSEIVLAEVCSHHARRLSRLESARHLDKSAFVAQTVVDLVGQMLCAQSGVVALKQEDIAEFAGLSRQSVNKALKVLENRGLVRTHYSRVEVCNLEALSQQASPVGQPVMPSQQ